MINIKFKWMSLNEDGKLLGFNSKHAKEISLSEINKIYLTVNKFSPSYFFYVPQCL